VVNNAEPEDEVNAAAEQDARRLVAKQSKEATSSPNIVLSTTTFPFRIATKVGIMHGNLKFRRNIICFVYMVHSKYKGQKNGESKTDNHE
jgi:hypothetical protein